MISVLVLSGCVWERPPQSLLVVNYTGQTIMVGPRTPDPYQAPMSATPVQTLRLNVKEDGCESTPWVATTEAGEVLAEVPGACVGNLWIIRGMNDFTYE